MIRIFGWNDGSNYTSEIAFCLTEILKMRKKLCPQNYNPLKHTDLLHPCPYEGNVTMTGMEFMPCMLIYSVRLNMCT